MKKIAALLFAAVLMGAVLLGSGCGRFVKSSYNKAIDSLYDNEEAFAKQGSTFNLNDSVQELGEDKKSYKAEVEFGGIATIWEMDAAEEVNVSFTGSLKVDEGKAKIIMVDPKGDSYVLLEVDSADENGEEGCGASYSLNPGKSRLRLAATDKSKVTISFRSDCGEWKKIG